MTTTEEKLKKAENALIWLYVRMFVEEVEWWPRDDGLYSMAAIKHHVEAKEMIEGLVPEVLLTR